MNTYEFCSPLLNDLVSTCALIEEASDAGYLIKQGNAKAPGMLVLSEIGITQEFQS